MKKRKLQSQKSASEGEKKAIGDNLIYFRVTDKFRCQFAYQRVGMGIDSDFRDLLERAAREGFFPQVQAQSGDFAYPCLSLFSVFIDDLNSLVRSLSLYHPGVDYAKPWQCRVWGDVFRTVGIVYNERFAVGLKEGRIMLDCNTPPNKGKAQASRGAAAGKRKDGQASGKGKKRAKALDEDGNAIPNQDIHAGEEDKPVDPKANYYQWPKDEDGSTWFLPTTKVQCSWEEIVYSDDPRPKLRFTEALTNYLLRVMPLPHDCTILLDCCVIDGKWDRRPIRVDIHHPFQRDSVTQEQINLASKQGLVTRRIYYDPDQKEAYGFGEADDRIIFHVYDTTVRCRKSVAVFSGDGDTDIALMATLPVRVDVQRRGPAQYRIPEGTDLPAVVHAMRRPRKMVLPTGLSRDVCDTIVIDTDRLAVFLQCHYGGGALVAQKNSVAPRILDATAMFALLVAMRPTDYTNGYPALSAPNLIQAAERHRGAFVEAFETWSIPWEEVLGPYRLLDCRIHVEALVHFITLATDLAYENGAKQCRAPTKVAEPSAAAAKRGDPPNENDKWMTIAGVTSIAMRAVWMLDKYVNGGLPGYELPDPFAVDPGSGKSLYGYAWQTNPDTKRREVVFTMDVHQRPVAHIVRA